MSLMAKKKTLIQKILANDGFRITLGVVLIGFGLYLFSLGQLNITKVLSSLIAIGVGISLLAGYKG